jgi:phosphoribosylaminoimidazolecarboxamide formyltransferase / IMP cyclohydrolase
MSQHVSFSGELVALPKYGENPWQGGAGLYADPENTDPLALHRFELQQGSPPSFNNYADIDRLLQTMTHIAAGFDKNGLPVPHIALGAKHGNMCGAGIGRGNLRATQRMLSGDPIAIFGGSTMLNYAIDEAVTEELLYSGMDLGSKRLLDVVTAPSITAQVPYMLERKAGKLRILTNPALGQLGVDSLDTEQRFRYVRGGALLQDNYTYVPDMTTEEWALANGELEKEQQRDILLAWAIGSTSTSNTITLVSGSRLIGNGVGQQDRVSAARLAIAKAESAGHTVEGAVAYSDSFFPFPDGPQTLVDAGISAVFTKSGSINDENALEPFRDNGVRVVTVPNSEGRGFYGH